MKHKFVNYSVALLITLSLLFGQGMQASLAAEEGQPAQVVPKAGTAAPNATVIVVETTADPNSSSITNTCNYTASIYTSTELCSFRRAIVEASARPNEDRPIVIRFDIPTSDPNYDPQTGTWTIQIEDALHPLSRENTLEELGSVFMDGNLIPGQPFPGTDDPPRIFIHSGYSLEVFSTDNIIRNLGWYGGGTIQLKSDNNTLENIWMGVTEDGQSMAFRDASNPADLAGGGLVIFQANNNIIRDSVVLGATGRAIKIDGGNNNTINNNFIGTRADGTVPDVPDTIECLRSLNYDPQNWYGGWGIQLTGTGNQVISNTIAGLQQPQTENETPPVALEIGGSDHLIQSNIIGVDSVGSEVGVCGQGMLVSGNGTDILENTIVRSRTGFEEALTYMPSGSGDPLNGAILVSDSSPTFGQVTIRGTIVRDGPGKVIIFGPGIPEALKLFKPARITHIDGTTVSGTSGDGSPCPNCVIDLYLDNAVDPESALELLASVVADGSGNFTVTLPEPLAEGEGIRTGSTTQSSGIIGSLGAGTSTALSELYTPAIHASTVSIAGPATGDTGVQYQFTITVGPANATTPLTYSIQATDLAPIEQDLNSTSATLSLTWNTPGTKTIQVAVSNGSNPVSTNHTIIITSDDENTIFLPMVSR